MFRSFGFNAVLLSSAILFAAGCDKSGSTPSGTGTNFGRGSTIQQARHFG